MFRPAARSVLRRSLVPVPARQSRFLATSAAPAKKSSWKSTSLRWAAAGAAIYYYRTSSVFADQQKFQEEVPPPLASEGERPPCLLDEVRKNKDTVRDEPRMQEEDKEVIDHSLEGEGGAEGLVEEAGQQGAFNPETGEINWDCPCLGGMAHGPCYSGENFRTAFSCFVYSTADPKGVDCIDKFKDMQACFQAHPEIYGGELDDDEDEDLESPEAVDSPIENPEETRSPASEFQVGKAPAVDASEATPVATVASELQVGKAPVVDASEATPVATVASELQVGKAPVVDANEATPVATAAAEKPVAEKSAATEE